MQTLFSQGSFELEIPPSFGTFNQWLVLKLWDKMVRRRGLKIPPPLLVHAWQCKAHNNKQPLIKNISWSIHIIILKTHLDFPDCQCGCEKCCTSNYLAYRKAERIVESNFNEVVHALLSKGEKLLVIQENGEIFQLFEGYRLNH